MMVKELAPAKINLFLDVTARRDDGFHDIKSIMHSVALCDEITISAEQADKSQIILASNAPDLSCGSDNLIYRSALKYLNYFNICAKIEIFLVKRIPIGAGLGGGSTDAAATLRAMNRIFCRASFEQLLEMSTELGSDVPFCLTLGTALCTGRGEKIEKLDDRYYNIVISIGKARVSTPKAYGDLDKRFCNFAPEVYEPIDNLELFYNVFECVTQIDEIDAIKEIMTKNGAESTLMSGSGPSVFGVFFRLRNSLIWRC